MTKNQIEWQNAMENIRHNREAEKEIGRHNVQTEAEAQRHNKAGETTNWFAAQEQQRHNMSAEANSKLAAQLSANAAMYGAQMSASASNYAAQMHKEASRYNADVAASTNKRGQWFNLGGSVIRAIPGIAASRR